MLSDVSACKCLWASLLISSEYTSVSINAALLHVIHLLSLIISYLSIALPYTPTFPTLAHIGRPTLRANVPFVPTTKYRDKHVLWMSSKRNASKHAQFLTAYGLLSYSVAYLAWSQGVEGIGVHDENVKVPATSVLRLMQAIAASPSLGVRSHEPGSLNHLGSGLDVTKVVKAVLDADGWWDESDWDIIEG